MKKIVALAVLLTMLFLIISVSANAETIVEEKQIRQTLIESVDAELYPNGVFDLIALQMTFSKDMDYMELAVVRRE